MPGQSHGSESIDDKPLHTQEELLRAQEVAQMGSWRLDVQSGVLLWSEETYSIFGLSPQTPLSYETFLTFVHPDDRRFVEQRWQSALKGNPYDIEHRILVDGQIKWVREKAYLEFDAHGKLAGGFGITQDVSERKRAETELKESHARARWLARFPEENPNPVVRVSADCTVLYRNPASGCPPWHCEVGQPLRDQQLCHLVDETMAHGRPSEADLVMDGTPYSVAISPLLAEGYLNLYGRNVSARKRAEHELRQSRDEAEATAAELARSNHDLQQFAYVASHDLQEPLRAVKGFLTILHKEHSEGLGPDALDCIHEAVLGAERMHDLLNGLLTYSRVGSLGGEFATTDMNAVLDDALANLRVAVADTGARVTRDRLPVVNADRAQMLQLLQNLIANALKFRSERPPEVHVTAAEANGSWRMGVRDNGIGVDLQFAGRIFDIFQRLHPRTRHPGTGIGLAVCKKIVERHGGEIWVESEVGAGSTFWFTLGRKGVNR